jgi:hypothetical protein
VETWSHWREKEDLELQFSTFKVCSETSEKAEGGDASPQGVDAGGTRAKSLQMPFDDLTLTAWADGLY